MQLDQRRCKKFNRALGKVIKEYRESQTSCSMSQFAMEYEIDKGNLSKLENGKYSSRFITIWFIAEALGVKFSDFSKKLEQELGKDFKLIDE